MRNQPPRRALMIMRVARVGRGTARVEAVNILKWSLVRFKYSDRNIGRGSKEENTPSTIAVSLKYEFGRKISTYG